MAKKKAAKKSAKAKPTKKAAKKYTVADEIYSRAGAGVANMADQMAKENANATLSDLLSDLENAAAEVQAIIDERGVNDRLKAEW